MMRRQGAGEPDRRRFDRHFSPVSCEQLKKPYDGDACLSAFSAVLSAFSPDNRMSLTAAYTGAINFFRDLYGYAVVPIDFISDFPLLPLVMTHFTADEQTEGDAAFVSCLCLLDLMLCRARIPPDSFRDPAFLDRLCVLLCSHNPVVVARAVGLVLHLTDRLDDAFHLLTSSGAIAILAAETSQSVSFEVAVLSLKALTWVVNASEDADQIAAMAVAFHEAAHSDSIRIRFCGLRGLEAVIRRSPLVRRHLVITCDLGGLLVAVLARSEDRVSNSPNKCLEIARDVFELGDDEEISAIFRSGLVHALVDFVKDDADLVGLCCGALAAAIRRGSEEIDAALVRAEIAEKVAIAVVEGSVEQKVAVAQIVGAMAAAGWTDVLAEFAERGGVVGLVGLVGTMGREVNIVLVDLLTNLVKILPRGEEVLVDAGIADTLETLRAAEEDQEMLERCDVFEAILAE
jgi:hypothetical protein